VDRKNFVGNIPELIDKTTEFLTLHTQVGARIIGFKRGDLPESPIEALREAVVNAVVQRDYSRVGETVRLFYYADWVEVHSPGLLLPGTTTKLGSYGTAKKEMVPSVEHRQHKRLNNRAENSHQPTRQREPKMRRFKSAKRIQRFLLAFSFIDGHFRMKRHLLSAEEYRRHRSLRFAAWGEVTQVIRATQAQTRVEIATMAA
jgi:hypothetical protein